MRIVPHPLVLLSLCLLSACEFAPMPSDSETIAGFNSHRGEFEYWRKVLSGPGQNCRIELDFGFAVPRTAPCEVPDRPRLSGFMRDAGVILIDAQTCCGTPHAADPSVKFLLYARGMSFAGEGKATLYDPRFQGPLVPSLDPYAADTTRSAAYRHWTRRIAGNWYAQYDSDF